MNIGFEKLYWEYIYMMPQYHFYKVTFAGGAISDKAYKLGCPQGTVFHSMWNLESIICLKESVGMNELVLS